MTLPVRTTPECSAQIRDIDDWWRRHRLSAPDLFLNELVVSFDTIADAPSVGRSYRPSPISYTRRVLLKQSRYHVYYVATKVEIRVLAVWHAQRGVGPPLRMI